MSNQEDSTLAREVAAMRLSFENLNTTISSNFKPIERAINRMATVPVSLAFCAISTWLFYNGKITENTWFYLSLVSMSPFFGAGIRTALERFFVRPEKVEIAAKVLIIGIATIGISGCSYKSWERSHERTYSAYYNSDTHGGGVSVTIRPVNFSRDK